MQTKYRSKLEKVASSSRSSAAVKSSHVLIRKWSVLQYLRCGINAGAR